MFDALGKILGFIQSAFDFFLNMIESLIQAVVFLASSVPFVTGLIPYLPSVIGSCVLITLSVAIVKFLIGR